MFVLSDDLLGHIVNQWSAVNNGSGVESAILQALPDHLTYSGLWEGSVVELLRLLGG